MEKESWDRQQDKWRVAAYLNKSIERTRLKPRHLGATLASEEGRVDIQLHADEYSCRHPHAWLDGTMRTVQMTLDEDLVRSVDRVVKKVHTTRSAFTRDALRAALAQFVMKITLNIRACRLRRRMLETVQAAVIISCLLHSSLYAAEVLTLSDISPKQAGNEVAVGGMGTSKAPGNQWSQHTNSQRGQTIRQVGAGTVVWTSDYVGYTYWHDDGDRTKLLPAMVELIGGTSLFDGRGLTGYTGSCLWRSGDGRTLYVDIYNTDIDVKADRLRPQGAMSFRIKLPFYDGMPSVRVVSPAGNYAPKASMADGWLRVDIPKLQHYASVIIRTAP